MRATPPERALAAEIRFVESGRNVRLTGEGAVLLVKSDSREGVTHRVRVRVNGRTVVFECSCPWGEHAGVQFQPSCRHAAGAAHRMEREGLLRWTEAGWEPTAKALAVGHELSVDPDGRWWACSCGKRANVASALRPDYAAQEAERHLRSATRTVDDIWAGLPS